MAQPSVSLRRLCRFPLHRTINLGLYSSQSRSSLSLWSPASTTASYISSRHLHQEASKSNSTNPHALETASGDKTKILFEEWSKFNQFPPASNASQFIANNVVTVRGFLSAKRVKGSKLVFADIKVDNGPLIHITSTWKEEDTPERQTNLALREIPLRSPVSVTGVIQKLHNQSGGHVPPTSPDAPFPSGLSRVDLDLVSIQPLNRFPGNIIVSKGAQFPPTARHLQIRFSDPLRSRLQVRPRIALRLREYLDKLAFTEVETPVLFKSTPEGAREFIVPTRRPGLAYALPQSPQQYKQMLMCSGIRGYYQFARCFRDEDLRADRQPEFTQLDLEMGFATAEDVMNTVEALVSKIPEALNDQFALVERDGEVYPVSRLDLGPHDQKMEWSSLPPRPFPRLAYDNVMSRFGVDKPDLRIPFEIRRVDQVLPPAFIGKITGKIQNPIVDAFRFRPDPEHADPKALRYFISDFMRDLPRSLSQNPDGQPAPIIYDSTKPMAGLSSLGFQGVDGLTSGTNPALADFADLQDGDIIFLQARPNQPFSGEGSTALGRVRTLLYQQAVSHKLLPRSLDFHFLWVRDFPMFTPNTTTEGETTADPGQGGHAGFSATHHPFTAPLTDADAALLLTDPLRARADHYDLVVNGVELGGGSRRIHVAGMQEFVMRHVLKMTEEGVGQFAHLLEALRAGCPPHAGFALGFDRLVAVFTHTGSVRDVIAFPKSMKGEDLTVGSPGGITEAQLETYHLALAAKGGARE